MEWLIPTGVIFGLVVLLLFVIESRLMRESKALKKREESLKKKEDSLAWVASNFDEPSKQNIARPIICFLSEFTCRSIDEIKVEHNLADDLKLDGEDIDDIHYFLMNKFKLKQGNTSEKHFLTVGSLIDYIYNQH